MCPALDRTCVATREEEEEEEAPNLCRVLFYLSEIHIHLKIKILHIN